MSAMPDESRDTDETSRPMAGDTELRAPVLVHRNAGLAALIGAAGSAIAIAYLWRASQTGSAADWLLCLVMAVIGAAYLVALVDSRTPLLVADDHGVRIRLGSQWRGLPWEALTEVVVRPRRGLVRDGSLLFSPRNADRAMAGLDVRGRWHARLNAKAYGATLSVPVGMTTRISTDGSVHEALAALAAGRVEVVAAGPAARPETGPEPRTRDQAPQPEPALPETTLTEPALTETTLTKTTGSAPDRASASPRRTLLGTLGTIVSRGAKRAQSVRPGRTGGPAVAGPAMAGPATTETSTTGKSGPGAAPAAPAPALPLRPTRPASRAEVTRDLPATFGNAALHLDPADDGTHETGATAAADGLRERSSLHRPGSVDLVFENPDHSTVRPIARAGDAVAPLVIDEFSVEPAADPVIGPELAAARTRLGLTVDDLAERTRIRPHVLEAIEVDDFAPCGGDFYARGHLRTLARVLGKDPAPLLTAFEDRYATAPLDARTVFEAELATGMTGSMRRTVGGPNWGLLVGVVLVLVLVWGLVRLFAGTPQEQLVPAPSLQPAPAAQHAYPHGAPRAHHPQH